MLDAVETRFSRESLAALLKSPLRLTPDTTTEDKPDTTSETEYAERFRRSISELNHSVRD